VDKKLYFHLFDVIILNSYMSVSSYSSKIGHGKFHLILVQNWLEMSSREPHP